MKLLSLTLRGAWGVFEGIGKDEVTVDFTRFSSGLIALVGGNGSGKTTLLENLHPYRRLASREGSLAKHFRIRDSRRDLTFEIGGVTYRSLIIIDAQTAKQEAYLYREGVPVNDGKTSTYDIAVEQLLGSDELYFRSIFAAQNAESITSLTAGKRKALFMELLGLDRYARYEEAAKTLASGVEIETAKVQEQVLRSRGELSIRDTVTTNLRTATEERDTLEVKVAECSGELNTRSAEVDALMVRITEQNALRPGIIALEHDIEVLAEKQTALGSTWKAASATTAKKAKEITSEIERAEGVLAHEKDIRAKLAELATLRIQEEAWKVKLEARNVVVEAERTAHNRFVALSGKHAVEMSQAQNRVRTAETIVTNLKTTAELSLRVPCAELPGVPERCELLSVALGARGRIGAAEFDLALCQQALAELALQEPTNGEDFTAQITAVGYDAENHNRVRESITAIVKARWEALAGELDVTAAVLGEKRKALTDLEERSKEEEARYAGENHELHEQITLKKQELANRELACDETLVDQYGNAKRKCDLLASRLRALTEGQADARASIAQAERRLAELANVEAQLSVLEVKETSLRTHGERLRFIVSACSKDGIPALELDAAGPAVSRIANELLTSTFGSRYQISFETTRESSDGKKQIETFEIRVYGADGEKHIEDLSGGQRVWIEKAIQEAISIYLSEKSGREYMTSYSDEYDGALDPDNKQHFLEMLRESFRLGRRHHALVITQTPEIWEQIQQKLIMRPAENTIAMEV